MEIRLLFEPRQKIVAVRNLVVVGMVLDHGVVLRVGGSACTILADDWRACRCSAFSALSALISLARKVTTRFIGLATSGYSAWNSDHSVLASSQFGLAETALSGLVCRGVGLLAVLPCNHAVEPALGSGHPPLSRLLGMLRCLGPGYRSLMGGSQLIGRAGPIYLGGFLGSGLGLSTFLTSLVGGLGRLFLTLSGLLAGFPLPAYRPTRRRAQLPRVRGPVQRPLPRQPPPQPLLRVRCSSFPIMLLENSGVKGSHMRTECPILGGSTEGT